MRKEYVKPEAEILEFSIEEEITAIGDDEESEKSLPDGW